MTEPRWVSDAAVHAIHEILLARTGGAPGILNPGQLESTLARPRQLFAYENAPLHRLAACYAYGLVKNHCFVDGNKRTALATMELFLRKNGHDLAASNAEAVVAMVAVAEDQIDEPELAEWALARMPTGNLSGDQ